MNFKPSESNEEAFDRFCLESGFETSNKEGMETAKFIWNSACKFKEERISYDMKNFSDVVKAIDEAESYKGSISLYWSHYSGWFCEIKSKRDEHHYSSFEFNKEHDGAGTINDAARDCLAHIKRKNESL